MLTVVRSDVDAIVATQVTAGDLASFEGDGYRYDLLAGDLIRVSPAGFRYGRLAAEIGRQLGNFLAQHPHLGVVVGAETATPSRSRRRAAGRRDHARFLSGVG